MSDAIAIQSLEGGLTAEAKRFYLSPQQIEDLACWTEQHPACYQAAVAMIKERPMQWQQVDMICALLSFIVTQRSTVAAQNVQLRILRTDLASAQSIADDAARADIETMCKSVMETGAAPFSLEDMRTCWYDFMQHEADDGPLIFQAKKYLESRNLLERHLTNGRLVRPLAAEPTDKEPS